MSTAVNPLPVAKALQQPSSSTTHVKQKSPIPIITLVPKHVSSSAEKPSSEAQKVIKTSAPETTFTLSSNSAFSSIANSSQLKVQPSTSKSPSLKAVPAAVYFLPSKKQLSTAASAQPSYKPRPWLTIPSSKTTEASREMISNPKCLASLNKRMGSTCTFYTSDAATFHQHLDLHKTHQPQDSENYMACAYCDKVKIIGALAVKQVKQAFINLYYPYRHCHSL